MSTINDLITTALRELGIVGFVDTPGLDLSNVALGHVNRILDGWNAQHGSIYADAHLTPAALTAGTNPHTIGPSGGSPTITCNTARPVDILSIRLTDDNGETYRPPMTRRSLDWWHAQTSPGSSADYPTDYAYDPTWPNGSIYFWPEPASSSVKAEIRFRLVFAAVALDTALALPQGYEAALTETLKERLASMPAFGSALTPVLIDAAREARAAAFSNNHRPLGYDSDYGAGVGIYDPTLGPYSLMRGGGR